MGICCPFGAAKRSTQFKIRLGMLVIGSMARLLKAWNLVQGILLSFVICGKGRRVCWVPKSIFKLHFVVDVSSYLFQKAIVYVDI